MQGKYARRRIDTSLDRLHIEAYKIYGVLEKPGALGENSIDWKMLEEINMRCLMDHIVLNVEDDDKMIDFYTNILQLQAERLEEYRTGKVPFPSVRLNGDTIIDFFPKKMWQITAATGTGRINMNHFCLALSRPDWEKLRQRLEANAIPIMEGPVPRWGAHGNGTSIYFHDPEENVIEARYYADNTDSKGCLLGS